MSLLVKINDIIDINPLKSLNSTGFIAQSCQLASKHHYLPMYAGLTAPLSNQT